jgi:Ras-related GTP-binding protein A/B
MENYLHSQRQHVFSSVGVLIYVFDIESRDFDRDLLTYRAIITALAEYSSTATIYVLVHKMDLVLPAQREKIYVERVKIIENKSDGFKILPFATSIWDQSLYKAWATIIKDLVPNVEKIVKNLNALGKLIMAEEVMLFERSSFLVVAHWQSTVGDMNPTTDRYERLSNIIKNFKQTAARYTGTPKSAEQFSLTGLKMEPFSFFITKFTTNTYLAVVLPPGEDRYNSATLNCAIAKREFEELDSPAKKTADRGATMGDGSAEGIVA